MGSDRWIVHCGIDTMIPKYNHATHLSNALPRLSTDITIGYCCGMLKDAEEHRTLKYDTLAFSGMSGALIAPIIAHRLKKDLLMIRKKGDNTHSCLIVEGNVGAQRIVVVDDFINSGHTVGRIVKYIRMCCKAKIVGLLLYHDDAESGFDRDLYYPGSEPFTNMIRAADAEK